MTALLLAVAMLTLLNFPSGIFGNIGIGLTANAEDNTETSTGISTITFTALDGTEGATGENYDKLIDGDKTSTKWCVTKFSSAYIVFKASERIFVDGYTITTGNDNSKNTGRNPQDWTLNGCNDYDEVTKTGGTWETIADVTNDNLLKDENNKDYDFSFTETEKKYQYFKLEITAIQSGNCMQMSEFTLSYTTCDHVWVKTDTTIAPTCTEGGYDVYTCSKCGSEKKGAKWYPCDRTSELFIAAVTFL
ncbi:MAG: hypothetical protein MRZ66_08445 [Clostridiales bacterium]|nr:hypothetical protein [Clostridiales bacterium]